MREKIRFPAFLLAVVVLVAPAAFSAKNDASAGRKIAKANADAVVHVRMVIKTRVVVEGREMGNDEHTSTAAATLIDPSGLVVLSYSATNPTDAFSNMAMGGEDSYRFSMESEISDVKIRFADGQEVPGEIVLRDKDLDLAFARPTEPLEAPAPYIALDKKASLGVLDTVVFLGRLGKVARWSPTVALENIQAVVHKPRTYYVTSSDFMSAQVGTPAFTTGGKCLGITLLRYTPSSGGMGGMGGMMDFSQMGLMKIILTSDDILEAAAQVPDRKVASE